ncbi:nucleotidyl cyclase domain-containing protein [Pedobacter endophyticus]|uniref:Guanylate cyclase domain-containing protein n=1 Tax=Pedobacter endophyticus TaxID=2789740 RepID=A0A7U3Q4V5_9SPHI|nr:adenylate/guanylate cyclase domain-containing protein [Pedobacter endophyticus]QPH38635.1 hypothetical protein IZT61_16350 [Pedobacter endophyticus]
MANLNLIKRFNQQYGKQSPIRRETKLFALTESLDPQKIQKALPDSLAKLGLDYTIYFDMGLEADVALLFIDVCNFSSRFSDLDGEDIGIFFDAYYDIVIPIIYKYSGEIDKIIGDGIICVFGLPYIDGDEEDLINQANNCAKEIIKSTKGTKFSSKIAAHYGTINYFKNKSGLYTEFTMIGKPLTELFRLESISINERINYYQDTKVKEYYTKLIQGKINLNTISGKEWSHRTHTLPPLQGVDYKLFNSITLKDI